MFECKRFISHSYIGTKFDSCYNVLNWFAPCLSTVLIEYLSNDLTSLYFLSKLCNKSRFRHFMMVERGKVTFISEIKKKYCISKSPIFINCDKSPWKIQSIFLRNPRPLATDSRHKIKIILKQNLESPLALVILSI